MAIQMTRKEYEAKYGVAPVFSTQSSLDTSPAPISMTRAEYDSIYGTPKKKNIVQKTKEQVSEAFSAGTEKSTKGFESIVDTVKDIKNIKSISDVKDTYKKLIRGELRFLGGGVDAAFSPIAPVFEPVGKGVNKVADKIGNIKAVQKFASGDEGEERIQKAEDVLDLINIGTVVPVGKVGSLTAKSVGKGIENIPTAIDTIKAKRTASITNNIANEIANVENNYSKLRKANDYSKDSGAASRQRIAMTDVLVDSADTDGILRTTQKGGAVDKYKALTIDGNESIVRDNLARLGESTNIKQVENYLMREVGSSGLEGADLVSALNGIKKELKGLQLKADEFGNIPNETLHDAKINTTNNINFQTPPETATYRKAIARSYKKLVEDNSSFNVEEVNAELSKYYDDIERLKALDGRRVKGAKLGKYFAQISGNVIGGAAGGAVGGPFGMALGTIVGGETAGLIKGKQMARSFGKERGLPVTKNVLLEDAKAKGKLPSEMKLKTPDKTVGAPKGIPKTKEIFKLEKDIAKNVEMQKKAIKAGDFTLVQALKEVYKALVTKLKEVIKRTKETPNKQGGSIDYSYNLGKRKTQYKNTKTTNKNAIDKSSTIPKTKSRVIEPDNTLVGEDAQIQKASIEKYRKNSEKLTNEYIKENGKIVNTDEARKLFKDVGYRGSNSASVQEASSAVAKDAWEKLLRTSPGNDSLIYAGGSGTGKTSAVKNIFKNEIEDAAAILDGNLSSIKSAQSRIQESITAGKHPTVVYVYREPADAWVNGVIKRMSSNASEGGRVVPLSVFVQNHQGSLNVVKTLLKDAELGKSFDLKMVDNSLGRGNQSLLSRSKFDSIKYSNNLATELKKLTKDLYNKGTITKQQYEALIK